MSKRPRIEGQLGLFVPETDWQRPAELPDLRGRPLVAIDTETRDDGITYGRGAGWVFGAGHVAGVSYWAEGVRGYAPIRHPETDNFDPSAVGRWLDDLFRSGTRVVFQNGGYDLGWIQTDLGIGRPESFEDTQAAAVMLDENRGRGAYNLDAICQWQGVPGKDEAGLRAAAEAFGVDPKGGIWKMPARYVGSYAEQDAESTGLVFQQMEGALRAQEVWDAYRLECDIVPTVMAMRKRGIRIDTDRALQTIKHFDARRDFYLSDLSRRLAIGRAITIDDTRSPVFLERVFDREQIPYPRTPKTNRGSFSLDWMQHVDHWLPKAICLIHKFEDAGHKFLENYILGFSHRGRVHSEIHQFFTDDGGTESHRFAYSKPPLQQMPSPDKDPREKDKKLIWEDAVGTQIRECFLPEEGTAWLACDYSQQEPRLTVHFASVCRAKGAERAVEAYRNNPRTDYHTMVAEMTGKARSVAKILNLGMTYGKGKRSLAEELNVSLEEGERILNEYHERMPFIKDLERICKNRASTRGYIRLLDGARKRYDKWEGGWIEYEDRLAAGRLGFDLNPCGLEEAQARQRQVIAGKAHPWSAGRLRRADTRKSLNNLVQGSAARQTKIAIREAARAGMIPLLQMHDELDFPVSSRVDVDMAATIMRDAVKLVVPMVVDAEVGPSWGRAKLSWDDYVAKYGVPGG